MIRTENDFRRHVIREAKSLGAHVSHLESHETSAGVPDLNLFLIGEDVWIELKVIKAGQIKMRPTQKRWHKERAEAGGHSWVLVLDPRTQDILRLPGHVAAALATSESAWRGAANVSNVRHLQNLLLFLTKEKP